MQKVLNNLLMACLLLTATATQATIITVFDGVAAGETNFENAVAGAGGTSVVSLWENSISGSIYDFGDYTLQNVDGAFISSSSSNNTSGNYMVSIDPIGSSGNGRTAAEDYINGGIKLVFDDPINAIGFEVEDWATCCFDPTTDLYISFDGGAPILVASGINNSDGLFPSKSDVNTSVYEIFVAAFDDSGSFTEVVFWGNGSGEILYAGGQVRYALLDQGSLPPNEVSEPSGIALLSLFLMGMTYRSRVRNAVKLKN